MAAMVSASATWLTKAAPMPRARGRMPVRPIVRRGSSVMVSIPPYGAESC